MNKIEIRIMIEWQEYNKALKLPDKADENYVKNIYNLLSDATVKRLKEINYIK